ncbi:MULTISPECIES: N-acetylmuramoyl-L-alanine amidase [Sporosarcina]|uniref:N-acetylmuramoyl-L-alanine amidase n=1 Tax=Sporosarcina TaxID=1569 RepID=UPI00058E5FF7|nr:MULTISPECIES: N-acetylmuramoyl-L-alanine amidase [Sporosarcina]WJY26466.1 N-acetylmuramoyl-L-alanine amidase [Sporosarcina sp. 0.2-SM1T-5]
MKKLAACLTLSLAALVPFGQESQAATTFTDVGTTHRAQAEIYYLVDGGITGGVSATRFVPEQQVTRDQAAAMLGRTLNLNGEMRSTNFKDVGSNNFASGYIQQLVDKNIISGYPDGSFKPKNTLSRGEMAMLISRTFDYKSSSVSAAASSLMNKGIAAGVADGTFGESQTIKRADFAVFLARSINADFRTANSEKFDTDVYVNVQDGTKLNMRKGPGVDYAAIKTIPSGKIVSYAYSVGDWAYITSDNVKGFVHSAYLQLDKPTDNPEVVPPTPPVTKPDPIPTPPGKKPLKDIVVVIDAGHGGKDSGAPGNGFLEKNITLNVAKKMEAYYKNVPIQAKMTRSGDTYPSLDARAAYAKKVNGSIFVSIHTNSHTGSSANGTETFYYSRSAAVNPNVAQSKALARYTQNRMLEAWGLTDRGIKVGNLAVLRQNTVPAVLAEMGFITNKKDIGLMGTEAGRQKLAKGLFLATLDYYYYYEGRTDVLPLYKTVNATPSGKLH